MASQYPFYNTDKNSFAQHATAILNNNLEPPYRDQAIANKFIQECKNFPNCGLRQDALVKMLDSIKIKDNNVDAFIMANSNNIYAFLVSPEIGQLTELLLRQQGWIESA